MKDRQEEARQILTKYHANGEPDHPLVELEIREMIASVRDEPPVSDWKTMFDLRQLVKTRGRRYRLMLNIVFAWFGQFSGNKYTQALPLRLALLILKASFRTTYQACSPTSASPQPT